MRLEQFVIKGWMGKLVVAAALTGLVACSSPTEKANAYYQKGAELLKKNELAKARLEFQNAVQINNKMATAWYGMAEVSERLGEWDKVFGLLKKVLELDPKHLDAQVKVGRLLLAAGKLDKALEASNKALEINKDVPSVLSLHAAVLFRLDDTKGAIEYANRAMEKSPDYVDALVILASERLLAGDSVKAIEYLDRGLKQNDRNLALQLIKVQALSSIAKLDSAEEILRKMITYYPDTRELRNALVQFYLAHDRKQDAEKELRAVVAANPTDLQAKFELVRFLRDVVNPQTARQALEEYVKLEPTNNTLKFTLVSFYQRQNDVEAAKTVLRDIIKRESDAKDGLTAKGMLAAILMTNGDKPAAMEMVGQVLAVDKRNEQALLLKANAEIEGHNLDEAISDLRIILRDAPNSSRALILLANAYERAGSPELADENYLHAFQAGKMAAIYGLPYAEFLLKRNQPQRAEKILEETLGASPANIMALKMLAQAKIGQGDWVGAQAVADRVAKSGENKLLAEQIKGAIFAGQKNYGESISAFRRAYETAPTQLQPLVSLVRTYLMAGKTKEATAFLDSVIQANPNNLSARLMQGQLYTMTGDIQKAETSYSTVIKLEPKNPLGYQQLAVLHLRNRKAFEAETVVAQGLAAVPNDMGLRMTKAGMYELSGKYDDAIKIYEGILKERPDADVVANNLASLLSEYRNDKASQARAYELAQRFKRSDVPQFKDTYGWASYKVGNFDEAKSMLQSATEQLPNVPILHYHLGMSYLAKGDKANARKELEKALQLAGNQPFDQAEEIRATLKGL